MKKICILTGKVIPSDEDQPVVLRNVGGLVFASENELNRLAAQFRLKQMPGIAEAAFLEQIFFGVSNAWSLKSFVLQAPHDCIIVVETIIRKNAPAIADRIWTLVAKL